MTPIITKQNLLLLISFFILTIISCNHEPKIKQEIKLDLSNKNLVIIPDSVFTKINLVYLDLGNSITFYPPLSALADSNANQITKISEKIGDLTNLEVLLLNGNRLMRLPNSISKLTNLEILDLSLNTNLNIVQELYKMKKLPQLKVLKIVGVKIEYDSLKFIKSSLPNTKIISSYEEYLDSLK